MKIQHFFSFTIILCSTILCSSCVKVHIDNIKLNKTELVLSPGYSEKLIATIYPEDADDKKVTWRSSDPAIISVNDDGLVTAIKDGEAMVTISTKDGEKTAACSVIVDYRNKWTGDYFGEYTYWYQVEGYAPNGPDITMETIHISISQDSCLLFMKGGKQWLPKINKDGYFFAQAGGYWNKIWDGYIIGDSINFSGVLHKSQGATTYHTFKGVKL